MGGGGRVCDRVEMGVCDRVELGGCVIWGCVMGGDGRVCDRVEMGCVIGWRWEGV